MGNVSSNNIGEKIILKILNDLKNKNPNKFINLTDTEKLNYVKKELKKYNLYIDKESEEYKNFNDLIILNKELNIIMEEIFKNYNYMHSQNKLFRMSNNLDNIINNFNEYSKTINTIKIKQHNLKTFINNFLKNQKAYKFEKNKIKSSEKSETFKKVKNTTKSKKTHVDLDKAKTRTRTKTKAKL